MKTVRHVCGNVDSCADGASHLYPATGETVTVWAPTEVPEVGGNDVMHEILPGQQVKVLGVLPDAHEAMVQHGPVEVWLDIDDIDGIDNSGTYLEGGA